MTTARHTLNELLVYLFNYILFIEEKNLQKKGVSLSMSEVHLLESIEKASDNTMSHIAKRTMVTQGTLTSSIKRLEGQGYVIRKKDAKDGRIVRLYLSEKGKDVLKIHDAFHESMIDGIIEDLKIGEDQILIESLEKIMHYFQKTYASDSESNSVLPL